MKLIRRLAYLVPWPLLAAGCGSSAPTQSGPAWIHQPSRTVDAGYIVYVGNGQDQVEQKAAFKAEGQALQDLANECSFAPKGARVEDRYETDAEGIYHLAYAKVAVDFQSCEDAKNAMDAEQIKKLANVSLTDEVKRYQEMMNEPPPPPVDQTMVAQGSAPPPPGPGGTAVFVVHDEPSFFVVRQQVAYVKQTVILAPPPAPGVPPPPPPAQQLASIQGPSRQIRGYEEANPTLKTTQPVWSQARTKIPAEMGGGVGARPAPRPENGERRRMRPGPGQQPRPKVQGQQGRGRRKRRKRD